MNIQPATAIACCGDIVERSTRLVTSDGQWVLGGSARFLAALGDPDPDYDAIGFAVKNLGFIKFETLVDSIVEIELHPRNVALPALLAAQQELLLSQVRLFRIKYFDTSWRSEITASRDQAIARLSELCAPSFELPPADRFLVEPGDYTKLFDDNRAPLRPLLQKWRMSFGHFDPTVISLAVEHGLLSRMIIFGLKPREFEPVFRFVGDRHGWLGANSQITAIGVKVTDQPDKDYGGWVSQFYKSVASSGQPRYDIVKAAIQTPSGPDPAYITRYERLLLPWRTPSDEVFVTMWSKKLGEEISSDLSPSERSSSVARKLARSS
jgi:hypothetical protein